MSISCCRNPIHHDLTMTTPAFWDYFIGDWMSVVISKFDCARFEPGFINPVAATRPVFNPVGGGLLRLQLAMTMAGSKAHLGIVALRFRCLLFR